MDGIAISDEIIAEDTGFCVILLEIPNYAFVKFAYSFVSIEWLLDAIVLL